MRVFNITDASTAALRSRSLENQHIRVGDTVIPPGGSADLRGTAREMSELQPLVRVRAVALDELPVDYAAKRGLDIHGNKLVKKTAEDVIATMPIPLGEESVTRQIFRAGEPIEFKDPVVLAPEETPRKKGK